MHWCVHLQAYFVFLSPETSTAATETGANGTRRRITDINGDSDDSMVDALLLPDDHGASDDGSEDGHGYGGGKNDEQPDEAGKM